MQSHQTRSFPALAHRQSGPAAATAPDRAATGLILGRVIDADTQEPVPGAALWVRSAAGESPVDIVRTSPGGDFVIRGLPGGRWFISVSKSGFLQASTASGLDVVLAEGERLTGFVLFVTRGAAITGTVTDRHGDPWAGLQVALRDRTPRGRWRGAGVATTDDRGVYRFSSLPAGEYVVTAASAAAAPIDSAPVITLSSGHEERGVDLQLAMDRPICSAPPGAAISGRITDERGNPLAATVQVLTRNAVTGDLVPVTGARPTPVRSDERGIYRIYGLPPGEYHVGVTHGMVGAGTAGHATTAADLHRARAGIAGPGGPGTLTVYAPMFHPNATTIDDAIPVRVGEGEERTGVNVTVRLVRGVAVAGSVVAPDGSTPNGTLVALTPDRPYIPASQILSSAGSGTAWSLGGLVTPPVTSSGRFTILSLTPGTYTLVAQGTARALPGVSGASEGAARLCARMTITLTDHDLTGLVVRLQAAGLARAGYGGT